MTRRTRAAFFALAALSLGPAARSAARTAPAWWEVIMLIKTEGEYRVEEPGASFDGIYRFVIRWTGRLDQDDDDFLLVHLHNEVIDWALSETPLNPGEFRKLTQEDVEAKPALNLKYALKLRDVLTFDFLIEGFKIPVNPSADKFPLILPSSEEDHQRPDMLDYNTFIANGSNSVGIPEKTLFKGRTETSFFWTWKQQDWVRRQNKTVFSSNRHRATVTITVIPHEK